MHARFNLDPGSKNWQNYFDIGSKIHKANKVIVETELVKFENAAGDLQAEKIINHWFPKINASVFLSHSHKDEKLIIGLAGWLSESFGIKSFIDSTVWGYSDSLLKEIDNKYCKQESATTYDYDKRNRSTSHVHMMLSTALATMIDQCECAIFVKTPNSFKPSEYFENKGHGESPWIYSEIAMTRMLRQRSPEEHRPKLVMDSVSSSMEQLKEARERELLISYPMDLLHLTPLSAMKLTEWEAQESKAMKGAFALDSLYRMTRT